MKRRSEDWVTICAAAMDTRDALRSRFIPRLAMLSRLVTTAEGKAVVDELTTLAAGQARNLMLAIKGRGQRA
jgi:hypothetical protein